MLAAVVVVLLTADPPRYQGGADPTPLSQPTEPDRSPSAQACTADTLRLSTECFFDANPTQNDSDAARKKQAQVNLDLAARLVSNACQRRAMPAGLDAKEKSARVNACTNRAAKMLENCSLDGVDALLDADGRFAKSAKRCYGDLASALQSGDVPNQPRNEPASSSSTGTSSSGGGKPIRL